MPACARRCFDGCVFRTRVAGSSAACTRNQAFPCIAQRSSANLDEDHRAQHSRHAALPPALWVRATPLGTCASVICRTVRAQSPSWRAAHSSPQTLIIADSQRTSLKCSWGVYHRPPPRLHLQSSQRKDVRRINKVMRPQFFSRPMLGPSMLCSGRVSRSEMPNGRRMPIYLLATRSYPSVAAPTSRVPSGRGLPLAVAGGWAAVRAGPARQRGSDLRGSDGADGPGRSRPMIACREPPPAAGGGPLTATLAPSQWQRVPPTTQWQRARWHAQAAPGRCTAEQTCLGAEPDRLLGTWGGKRLAMQAGAV